MCPERANLVGRVLLVLGTADGHVYALINKVT